MRTVNKVILIGNVARDPLIKSVENNKKVALFTVATNRVIKNARGEVINEAEYSSCVAWGVLAERCEQFLVKGKLVYIEGRLRTRITPKEDGTKSYRTEVVIGNLIFLNKRSDFAEAGVETGSHTEEVVEHDEFVEDTLDDDRF